MLEKCQFTREQILEAIRACARSLGRAPFASEMNAWDGPSATQARYCFGTWNNALVAAGFVPTRGSRDAEELLRDWGNIVRKLRSIPSMTRYQREGKYRTCTFTSKFGLWRNVPAEFLDFSEGKPDWQDVREVLSHCRSWGDSSYTFTKEEIVHAISSLADALGHCPSKREFYANCEIARRDVEKQFTHWIYAVRAAGLVPNLSWIKKSDGELLTDWGEIVRKLERIPLNAEYIREGKYGHKTYKYRFGHWQNVSEAFKRFADGNPEWQDVLDLLSKLGPLSISGSRKKENDELLADWGDLARRLNRVPKSREYNREGRYTASMFATRFGYWRNVPQAFVEFAEDKPEWADVLALVYEMQQAAERP